MPRRELLLIGEMIDAAEQAQRLVSGRTVDAIVAEVSTGVNERSMMAW